MSNLATVTPIKPHLEVVEHRVAMATPGLQTHCWKLSCFLGLLNISY
ncbi:hypothetical protein NUM70_001461 [Salmonella enterica]|nr:hypothetical protein [Salmonella enterica]